MLQAPCCWTILKICHAVPRSFAMFTTQSNLHVQPSISTGSVPSWILQNLGVPLPPPPLGTPPSPHPLCPPAPHLKPSMQLTPLPRVSLGLSRAHSPSPLSTSSAAALGRQRWQPGMLRIPSGQDLKSMARRVKGSAGSSSSSSDWGPGPGPDEDLPTPTLVCQLPLFQPPQHPVAAAAGYCPRRSFSESGLADMGGGGGPAGGGGG
jgi:hypothetical protein